MAIRIRAQVRADLRTRYAVLREIPGRRWATTAGQAFLHDCTQLVDRYGQRQIAEAIGVSPQAIGRMLKAYDPARSVQPLRTDMLLGQLHVAWGLVQRWRGIGRQVRRHHETYRRMHEAAGELALVYQVPTIAKLSGIRAQELHRFMDTPDRPTFDDVALLALLEEYDGGRALQGPRRRAFLAQLEETLASHELVDIARVLNVSPRVVRTWMVDKAHGKRSEGPETA